MTSKRTVDVIDYSPTGEPVAVLHGDEVYPVLRLTQATLRAALDHAARTGSEPDYVQLAGLLTRKGSYR